VKACSRGKEDAGDQATFAARFRLLRVADAYVPFPSQPRSKTQGAIKGVSHRGRPEIIMILSPGEGHG